MAEGLIVLNPHLGVSLYNGGAIDEDLEGIAPVFDKYDDVEAYHESAEGHGFDVVLKAKDEVPMAVTHAVILGPTTCSCPLGELGIFVRPEPQPDAELDAYVRASAAYRKGGLDEAGPGLVLEARSLAPFYNGLGRAAAPTPFGHIQVCLRTATM